MKNDVSGVYKITNLINGKTYIGISKHIFRRWQEHKWSAKNIHSKSYNYPLSRAIRKYGIENFSFEILEELNYNNLDLLKDKEKYYILQYNSINNGYNQTEGGDISDYVSYGENNPNHAITTNDVINIRKRWAAKKETTNEIYLDYQDKINRSTFGYICAWKTWPDILPELNTEENKHWHLSVKTSGEKNGRAKLKERDVINIRHRKNNGETLSQVYKDYSNIIGSGGFENVWYGKTWKNVIV